MGEPCRQTAGQAPPCGLKELESRLREAEAELRRRSAQLAELALQLTEAESKERRQLAELLHDHLQQLLVGVRMRLCRLRRQVPDPALCSEIDGIDRLTAEALESSRTLTYDLCPPAQQREDLASCLFWLATWMRERHGLDVVLEATGALGVPDPSDPRLRNFLYQSARELLFNVVKHAGVEHAHLRVRQDESGLIELVVEDAGVGMTANPTPAATPGYGLAMIRERLELLGGKLEIQSAHDAGTRVLMRCPTTTSRDGDGA